MPFFECRAVKIDGHGLGKEYYTAALDLVRSSWRIHAKALGVGGPREQKDSRWGGRCSYYPL